jgi:poly-gamma-glutamate synthesis protein (capsule biosynthesis protein)
MSREVKRFIFALLGVVLVLALICFLPLNGEEGGEDTVSLAEIAQPIRPDVVEEENSAPSESDARSTPAEPEAAAGESASEDLSAPETEVTEEETHPVTVIFTGDVMPNERGQSNYDSGGIDAVVDPALGEILRGADILEINHEFPFSLRGEAMEDKQWTFRVDPKYVTILQEMGVDVAGLANNHGLDYGRDALLDTLDTLSGAGILYTGAGANIDEADDPAILEAGGMKIGILAATRVIPVGSWNAGKSSAGMLSCYDTTRAKEVIARMREECDYVFVCVHWGVEKTTELTDYQPAMGHEFIDVGADGVIGSHPHCLQGVEFYKGKPIFYSLGNFLFNSNIQQTAAVEFTLDGEDMKIRVIPTYEEGAKAYLSEEARARETYEALEALSPGIQIDETGYLTEM